MKFHVLGILIVAFTLLNRERFLHAHGIDDDDLLDFPFDVDDNTEAESKLDASFSHAQPADQKLAEFDDSKLDDFTEEFLYSKPEAKLDDFGEEFADSEVTGTNGEHSQKPSFISNKEKLIRIALVKALTNKALRQKFVEVIPILRALSKPQRLAFASLISAQFVAKPGQELKLKQVESLFGNSRKLILPIVLDIANLVKLAAKNVLGGQYSNIEHLPKPQAELTRRTYEVLPGEEDDIKEYEEYMDEIMDAKQINEGLYSVDVDSDHHVSNATHSRTKRSAPLSFFDRLAFLLPKRVQRRSSNGPHQLEDRKLNVYNLSNAQDQQAQSTESVQTVPNESVDHSSMTYEQIEDLAFNDLNGTEAIETNQTVDSDNDTSNHEKLPKPESLIRSRPRIVGNKLGHGHRKPVQHLRQPIRTQKQPIPLGNCERFTSSMCIRAEDYPMDQIMGSIRRHRIAMSALLAEYRDKTAEVEHEEYLEDLLLNKKRREDDNTTPGGMCASVVRYARPQKARSATGEWKFIVNTGQHTQTLRLEKCSNPQESCSYLTDNYRSRCIQVYNYHRLLSWDKSRGLHVDIFKVPTCCSCHVDGYRDLFPPLGSNGGNKLKDFNHYSKVSPYSTITEDDDYDDDDEGGSDSIAYQFGNGFKKVKSNKFDPLFSSSNIKTNFDIGKSSLKSNQRTPALGTYLSPPYDEFDPSYSFKRGPELSSHGAAHLGSLSSSIPRRSSLGNTYSSPDVGDRLDQDVGGSEGGKEVTVYPPIDRPTVRPKRKRISSVSTAQQIAATRETRLPGLSPSATTDDAAYSSDTILNTKSAEIDAKADMNKRINYSYHPIIDFFGEQARNLPSSRAAGHHASTTGRSFTGYRAKNEIHNGLGVDNNWRPVVIE